MGTHESVVKKSLVARAASAGGVTAHNLLTGLGADDHSQYSLVSGARAFTGEVAGVAPTVGASLTTKTYTDGLITTHEAAADPHTGYQKESEKGVANGYASLGAGGLVPMAQLASGVATGSKFIRDDGTLQVPAGGSTPTGTGFRHVTAGVEDAASKKVELDNTADVQGVLDETNGGTGQSTLTKGDMLYATAANTFAKLGIGSADNVLMTDATGLPAWTALLTKISGSSGAAGNYTTWQTLSSNAAANATTTVAAVMTTTGVGSGTWAFKYLIRYQSSATTTGVFFSIDHGGTVSTMVYHMTFVSTGGAAATGVADQVSGTNAGQLVEGKSARTDNATVAGGHTASAGVDTINADCLMVLEGIFTCSTSGSLILNHASETANSTQVMAGTTLELRKVA